MNISSRVFQIYCTWYLLTVIPSGKDSLSNILLTVWITSTALLPFSGVLADRYKKSKILFVAALLTTVASICAVCTTYLFHGSIHANLLVLCFIITGFIFSTGNALLFPLGTPLIPEIANNEINTSRGIRLKSSMLIVNLLFGPTLAGLVIGKLGGEFALLLSLLMALFGLVLSIVFLYTFEHIPARNKGIVNTLFVFRELGDGVRRLWKIDAERNIAIASLFANMLFVPFLFLILPAKILTSGFSMLDLALIEISLGAGVLVSSGFLIGWLKKVMSEHCIASIGICLLGFSVLSFAYSGGFWLLCVFGFLLGIGLNTFNVTVNSKRAISIPNGYRSTMESTLLFFCTAAVPVGLWITKLGLDKFSPNQIIILFSTTFFIAVTVIIFSRSLRLMLNAPNSATPYYITTNEALFH